MIVLIAGSRRAFGCLCIRLIDASNCASRPSGSVTRASRILVVDTWSKIVRICRSGRRNLQWTAVSHF